MSSEVEKFYDDFSGKLFNNYIYGNPRIARQFEFFSETITGRADNILIIGCGFGDSAYFIADKITKTTRILAVDISDNNLRIARALFCHPRVEYRRLNVLEEPIPGDWDVIVLPDVYEHIPASARKKFHEILNDLLMDNGRILITVPSPGHQEMLRKKGEGLQIIDETVTLDDLVTMAAEFDATLSYFSMISVWMSNDYMHAMIERDLETRQIQTGDEILKIKRQEKKSDHPLLQPALRILNKLKYRLRWAFLRSKLKRAGINLEKWKHDD